MVTLTEVRNPNLPRAERILRYEIHTTTGYRAVLPACVCDRVPCVKGTCRTHLHCHYGMHEVHAVRLVAEVVWSYGSARTGRTRIGTRVPVTRAAMTEQEWRAARGEIGWGEIDG